MKRSVKSHFFVIILAIISLSSNYALAESTPPDPTAVGPYKVGYMSIPSVSLPNGLITNVSIWYPTDASFGTPADYTTTRVVGSYTTPLPNSYKLPSLLGAYQNAPVAEGTFPMILAMHGSGSIDTDNGRFTHYQFNEFLAT